MAPASKTGVAPAPLRCGFGLWRRTLGRHGATAALVMMVAVLAWVQLSRGAQDVLQFDRAAIAGGQWWRLLTGNFVHYGWGHWAANVGALAALLWVGQGRSRWTPLVVIPSAAAVGLAIYHGADGVTTYRGVSGVDCALLAWVLVIMAFQDRGWLAVAWLTVLALVVGKSVFELATGQLLLPTSAPVGVEVVGVTHVVGLGFGAATAIIAATWRGAS